MGDQFKVSLENLVSKLVGWLDAVVVNLPNLLLSIIVILVAVFLSRRLSARITNLLHNRIKQSSVRTLIGSAISIFILLLGLILALGILNLDQALNSLIAGAGVAGLAIGLAVQGTLSNTFSGISLSIKNDINVGDFIETNGFAGTIVAINLRDTKIRTLDNNLVIIPNNAISNNPYKNFSLTKDLRVVVDTSVAYDSDLKFVEEIAEAAITKQFPYRASDFEFYYMSFGDSAINIQLRFWIQAKDRFSLTKSRSQAIVIVKDAFELNGIDIPFPIRSLYVTSHDDGKNPLQ